MSRFSRLNKVKRPPSAYQFIGRRVMWLIMPWGVLLILGNTAIASTQSSTDLSTIIIPADQSLPLHDWTMQIEGSTYGLMQWGGSDCTIFIGSHRLTIPAPAYVVALLGGFVVVCLGLTAFWWNRYVPSAKVASRSEAVRCRSHRAQ